jgi:ribokinase
MGIFTKSKKTPDFMAVGDIVIDQFIRIAQAHKTINKENQQTELCMVFGTKLPFDFAEEVVAVGNSANAAVAAARLGLSSGLVAHIGDDENGQKCLDKLKQEGVSTDFVEKHKGLHTNYHFVLWFGSERTILIKHEKFPETMPDINPKWLYLSSLGENSLPFHTVIEDYLDAHPDINVVFQPGTYQIKFGTEALARLYKRTNLFFCNLEEAQIILNNNSRDVAMLLANLRTLGPKLPVITDGPNGAYTFAKDSNGVEYVAWMPIYPDIAPPFERTGAGDAFASTFSAAIALGKSEEVALKWGSINSMSVCQGVGAQKGLLTHAQIEEYMKKAPTGWVLKRIV